MDFGGINLGTHTRQNSWDTLSSSILQPRDNVFFQLQFCTRNMASTTKESVFNQEMSQKKGWQIKKALHQIACICKGPLLTLPVRLIALILNHMLQHLFCRRNFGRASADSKVIYPNKLLRGTSSSSCVAVWHFVIDPGKGKKTHVVCVDMTCF